MHLHHFTFNPFLENTYLLWDDAGEAAIIDPGMYDEDEEQSVVDFLEKQNLQLRHNLNTHEHLDHVFGNDFIHQRFGLKPVIHPAAKPVLEAVPQYAQMFGVEARPSPEPVLGLNDGSTYAVGQLKLDVAHTPGHAPGHVVLFHRPTKTLIGGDMLFAGSIGRVDLPGADPAAMERSLKEVILSFPDETAVYPGHGPSTSLGHERQTNPFLQPGARLS